MRRIEEQRSTRQEKYQELKRAGYDPYPAESTRTHSVKDLKRHFDALAQAQTAVVLAGRIRAIRQHGGATFVTIQDDGESFQVYLKRDALGEQDYRQWLYWMDLGDFFEFTGTLFRTRQQQPTLLVQKLRVLTKSLRTLPEKFHGLRDAELRLRHRYLDLLMNPDVRTIFEKKALFWKSIRKIMMESGFLEVETPVLEAIPGGAETEPFMTHHRALDEDLFLRISLELPLKRLLVGGFNKVFEIGRIFRNEGISPEHLQDYTQLEFYWAYANYHDLMAFLPKLYRRVIHVVCGSQRVTRGGQEVDWGRPWQTYDYYELFAKQTNLDLGSSSDTDLRKRVVALKVPVEPHAHRGRLIDLLFKQAVRPTLIEPGFLINPPVEIEPLAKRLPGDPRRVQRLQVMAWGTELGKGFSELNDPLDQRERFAEQMKLREAGDQEAQRIDEDFLEALEYGMPPAAGFGLSERLFAVIMDRPVRETVIFPSVRTKATVQQKKRKIKKT